VSTRKVNLKVHIEAQKTSSRQSNSEPIENAGGITVPTSNYTTEP
jgi:hypothetical protein